MEKKELKIRKNYIIIGLLSLVLSFLSLTVYQTQGNWSWIDYNEFPRKQNPENSAYQGEKLYHIFKSPYKNLRQYEFSVGSDFGLPEKLSIGQKIETYVDATLSRKDYLIYVAIGYFIIMLFLTKFKFKLV